MASAAKQTSQTNGNGGVDTAALDRFRGMFKLNRAAAASIIGQSGVEYFPEYFDGRVPVESYVEKAKLIARLTDVAGRDVLDVGCGHGFATCLLAAVGANVAVGVDLKDDKIGLCRQLAAHMGLANTVFRASPGEKLPFDEESFDVVCISAALSHVCDIEATLREMKRVLKPGGAVYIFEDNNELHLKYHSLIDPVLEFAETGRGLAGHASAGEWVPYIARRERMIREWFPELNDAKVKELAAATKGLVGDEIRNAVNENVKFGRPVVVNKPFLYYAPDTGEAMEYPFTPPLLRETVGKHFENPRIHSAWTPPYRGLKGIAKRVLKVAGCIPWVFNKTQATYIVTATKPGTPKHAGERASCEWTAG
jgi:ubiquinone/menaquinone biosynthesis C-methylase UbiE